MKIQVKNNPIFAGISMLISYEKVVKGVSEIMGGQVIELECVKQWNAGKAEGWNLGVAEGRALGVEEGRVLAFADMGLSKNKIAEKVGITEDEVNKILEEQEA